MKSTRLILIVNAIIAVSSLISAQTFAQESPWIINSVAGGIVYRTEEYGISTQDQHTKRSRSAISLMCAQGVNPKIFLQWENMQGYGNIKVNYTIDDKPVTPNGKNFVMKQENDILYKDLSVSQELLQAMKIGRTLTVDWVGYDQRRYLTTFNLSTFRSNLSQFNKKCNTDI